MSMERLSADSFYLVHKHPSGNPTPSFSDMPLTSEIGKLPSYAGHIVLDHIK